MTDAGIHRDRGSAAASGLIRSEVRGRTGLITIDRPDKLNALTVPMLRDLAAGIRGHGVRDGAVVLTGAGRAFSAGDDLDATEGLDRPAFEEMIDAFNDVTRAIYDVEVPVVAALNGIAVGGAAEIACACDIRVGGPASEFMFPENGLGLTISNGSTATLPALLGPRAIGVVMLGRRLSADDADRLGLIDVRVDDATTVVDEAVRIAEELAEDGRATSIHLRMLRVPREEIERALARERDAALESVERGLPQKGIERFLAARASRKR